MKPGDKCGIFLSHTSLHDCYRGLEESQNRGRESAGIAAHTNNGIDITKWEGEVSAFKRNQLVTNIFGDIYIGHVRYSTIGPKDKVATNAHPHHAGGKITDDGNIVRVRGADAAIVHNGNFPYKDDGRFPEIDSFIEDLGARLYSETDTELMLHYYLRHGEERLMEDIPGSFSLSILDSKKNHSITMRDRFGFKPLHLGIKDGKYLCASEDSAIEAIGGLPIREVREGEIIYINGPRYWVKQVVEPVPHACFFEFNYVCKPTSTFTGRKVSDIRWRLGEQLASEFKPDDADLVTYAPSAPIHMAHAYHEATNIPFRDVFFKRREKRSFQGPTQGERRESLKKTLFSDDRYDLEEKTIIVIDDSIVRMNVLDRITEECKKRGVKKLYLLSATPMIGIENEGKNHGCNFGVDMPPGDEDFAAMKYGSVENMERHLSERYQIDVKIHYIDKDNMIKAYRGLTEKNLCTHCIGGYDPIEKFAIS